MASTPQPPRKVGSKRKAAGWMLTTIAILFTALWAHSRWWYTAFETTNTAYVIRHGVVTITVATGPTPTSTINPGETPFRGAGFINFSMQGGLQCWYWLLPDISARGLVPGTLPPGTLSFAGAIRTFSSRSGPWTTTSATGPAISSGGAPMRTIEFTLWPLPLLLLAAGLWLIRSSRRAAARARGHCCTKCGYSLAGLTTGSPCPECGRGTQARSTTPNA